MMRRGESFHGIAGGGRFWLELVRTCPCLSVSIRHPIFVKLHNKKKKGNEGKAEIKPREDVERKKEREGMREKGKLEELEGRLSYIGRRSCARLYN